MIRLGTSPTPIGLTPGRLSSGTSRQETKAEILVGSTSEVYRWRPTAANAEQRSQEADQNDEHSRLHVNASTPDGPADPCICMAIV